MGCGGPAAAAWLTRSSRAVPRRPCDVGLADGFLTGLGDLTWPVVRDLVDGVVTVTEAEMIAAMRLLWERAKLLVEPSAAVALAAVLTGEFRQTVCEHHVGIVLSGGNVNVETLPF